MRFILLILLSLILYSCAAKKFMVENADSLLTHQVTKRLPLYSKQKDILNRDIDKLFNESKPLAQEILPVIDQINLNDEEKIEQQYKRLEDYYMNLAKDFSALMSKHMARLDKKQRKEFFETLDDENREILKQEHEKRLDRIEDRFEMFFGSIKGPQKQLLREYSDYFEKRSKERLERRVKLHEEFRSIFKQDISEESREKMIQEAFVEYQQKAMKGNKNLEMIKKLLPTLSKEQREHFRERISEVKEMLKYFIATDY